MTFTTWRRTIVAVLGILALLFGGAAMALAPQASAADGTKSCGTADWLQLCVSGSEPLAPNQPLRIDFSGNLPDGKYHAGDTVTITVPGDVSPPKGKTYELKDPSGAVVATMTVAPDGKLVLKFTDFVDTHKQVSVQGWLQAELSASAEPGTETWVWDVGGTAIKTPVTIGSCTAHCSDLPTAALKWAVVDPDDPSTIGSTLVTPALTQDSQAISWTDTVGPGQRIDCDDVQGAVFDSAVGGLLHYGGSFSPTVVSCNGSTITATYGGGKKGLSYGLSLHISITDQSRTSWTDKGTVTVDGVGSPVQAEAVQYDGGGSGSGTVPSAPPTSPTTTPSSPTTTPSSPTTTPSSPTTTPSSPTTTPSSPTTTPSSPGTPTYPVGAPTDAHTAGSSSYGYAALMIMGLLLVVGASVPFRRSRGGRHTH